MKPSKQPPAAHGGQTLGTRRTIIHIDLDCFYAQVEMVRNPSLCDRPVGIQQKNIVVTCNYPARNFGVTKLMLVADALKKCPDLVLVSGEDLTHYREASLSIYKTVSRFSPTVERLVLDELWLDVSSVVEKRIEEGKERGEWMGYVMAGEGPLEGDKDGEKLASMAAQSGDPATLNRLRIGSIIAAEIRSAVFRETGYTCCAGVAWSKMSSKMTSGMHKPNQQTTLWPEAFGSRLTSMRVRQLPGIGHSTAKILRDLAIENVERLQRLPLAYLTEHLGEKMGALAFNLSRGVDDSPVTPRGPPKSISDEDSFVRCNTVPDVHRRLSDLVRSVVSRVQSDHRETGRLPQTLRLTTRHVGSGYHGKQSRQIAIPPDLFAPVRPRTNHQPESENTTEEDQRISAITDIAMGLFNRLVPPGTAFHLTLLNVCVANFRPVSSSFTQKHGRQPTIAQLLKRPASHPGMQKAGYVGGNGNTMSISQRMPQGSQISAVDLSLSVGANPHTDAKLQSIGVRHGYVNTGKRDIVGVHDWSDEGGDEDDWMSDNHHSGGDDFDWSEIICASGREDEGFLRPGGQEPDFFTGENSETSNVDKVKSICCEVNTELEMCIPDARTDESSGVEGEGEEVKRVNLPEGIDADVFNQLPSDLQKEILDEYSRQRGEIRTGASDGMDENGANVEGGLIGGESTRKRRKSDTEFESGKSGQGRELRQKGFGSNPSPAKKPASIAIGVAVPSAGKGILKKSGAKVNDIRKFFGSGPTLKINSCANIGVEGTTLVSNGIAKVDEMKGVDSDSVHVGYKESSVGGMNEAVNDRNYKLKMHNDGVEGSDGLSEGVEGATHDMPVEQNAGLSKMESYGVSGRKYKCCLCGMIMFAWCREAHERFHSSEGEHKMSSEIN